MKSLFKILALVNKKILPSLTKERIDLRKANKLQLMIIWWRSYITLRSLD